MLLSTSYASGIMVYVFCIVSDRFVFDLFVHSGARCDILKKNIILLSSLLLF